MRRTISYIDGFNLYYGLRENGWRRLYWLNLQALSIHLLRPDQVLVATKYFTSIVDAPEGKHRRQALYLDAVNSLLDVSTYLGHFLRDTLTCHNCGRTHSTFHEKMTDVNIATEMLTDAFSDRFDVALLISADSDLLGPVRKIRDLFPEKRVVVVFPPKRHSTALQRIAHACLHLDRALLLKSQFPDDVVKPDGYVLRRPAEWR